MLNAIHSAIDALRAVFQALSYGQTRHAAMVHLPAAISMLGLLAVIAVIALRGRSKVMTWATVCLFALGVGAAFLTTASGDMSMVNLDQELTKPAQAELDIHQEMADKVWMFMAGTGALVALSAIPKKSIRVVALTLALLSAAATAGWVAVTADHGGHLVYQYGVGVPGSPNNLAWPDKAAGKR